MDNNNKQDPNMKSNWQTITMLVVAAILTFIVVSSMNNYLNSKKRQELSYNEFVQMVEAGEVDSIKVGSTEITVIPKKGNTKYSQNLDYYVVRLEGDYDFVNRILDNNVVTNREKSDSSTLLLVRCPIPVPAVPYELHHEAHGRRRNHGRGQVQCQDVRPEGNRHHLQGCGW